MAVFTYEAVDQDGNKRQGSIEAVSIDLAITALQRRGLIVSSVDPEEKKTAGLQMRVSFFERITGADIVMLSRQMATLFEAQVSALRGFRLLAAEARTPKLADKLSEIGNDIQGGSSISAALAKHPEIFSSFYVNMVRAGEETGKLDETFSYLADYLDRNYEISSKARNALIYPAFILLTFAVVMTLMMTLVIPNLASMLTQVGQNIPWYTGIIIGFSDFISHYFILLALAIGVAAFFFSRYARTASGRMVIAHAQIELPAVGEIYRKIYLSRVADNLSTMLKSGIQILRGLEITGSVVENLVYQQILEQAAIDVKGGMPLSEALRKHPEFPGIMVAMVKIGEETGNMGTILETMARFYRREVDNAIDTLVGLIEPFIIVILAVGVGILLASVLLPIYNIAASF